jgi:hypothetical protein
MYVAYLDESGSYPHTRVLAIAGYAAPAIEWARLEYVWKKMLRSWNVNAFHMVDCIHGRGEFTGWDQQRRNAAIKEVIDLVVGYDVHGIGAAVLLRDYEALVTGRARREIGEPWHLCLRHLVFEVSRRIDRLPRSEWVAFVCDLQEEFSAEASRMYERCRENPEWPQQNRLGTLTFASSKEEVGLQVADLLAYETFRHLDNKLYCNREIRKSLDRLVHERPYFGAYYTREELEPLAAKWRDEQHVPAD